MNQSSLDFRRPNPARIYDYLLGGKDSYEVDREAAAEVEKSAPDIRKRVRDNREFLIRAVRFLVAEAGIRQLIDLGSGLPTQRNVHEVAHAVAPDVPVVYVDHDPVVVAHGEALLSNGGNVIVIEADMRRPDEILNHSKTEELIDFNRPMGILAVAVLHFITDDENPAGIVSRLCDAMAPGSYLALSHACGTDRRAIEEIEDIYKRATSPVTLRTPDQVEEFFEGFEYVEPGLVNVAEWRSDPNEPVERPKVGYFLGGVGHKT